MEAGLLIAKDGSVIYRHVPPGRSSVFLPDSRSLWDAIWENRERVYGFAHSHPGRGVPGPSGTDVTTFEAIEAALGRRLLWWIASEDCLIKILWLRSCAQGDGYRRAVVPGAPPWLGELRRLSSDVMTCSFPGCNLPYVSGCRGRCETHKHEPDDCAHRAGAPFHTDERCPSFRE